MLKQTLYLMVGYPGSGKTTTADVISQITGAIHLWADQERRELYKNPTYSHDENIELYNKLNEHAEKLLKSGKSVVYDTNFNFYKDRQKMRVMAAKYNADTVVIWVQTAKEIAKERATKDAVLQTTRVLGNMAEHQFERIASNLEEPRSDETTVTVDGTIVTPAYVTARLATLKLSEHAK